MLVLLRVFGLDAALRVVTDLALDLAFGLAALEGFAFDLALVVFAVLALDLDDNLIFLFSGY